MEQDRTDLVRGRAYELWERAGRPEDDAERFWFEAERELAGDADGSKLDEALDETFPASDPSATTYRTKAD